MTTAKQRQGGTYRPSPPPLQGGLDPFRQWCQREFDRLADTINNGRLQWAFLDVITVLPEKPLDGMICYFAANVTSGGAAKGAYEYREGSGWSKL